MSTRVLKMEHLEGDDPGDADWRKWVQLYEENYLDGISRGAILLHLSRAWVDAFFHLGDKPV